MAFPQYPEISEEDRSFINSADCVNTALFELAEAMNLPFTNNYAHFKDNDFDMPIFEISHFIEEVIQIFIDQGWTPPSKVVAKDIET